MRTHRLFLFATAVMIASCGGGGATEPSNPPPSENGSGITFDRTDTVTGIDANGDGVRDDLENLIASFALTPDQTKAVRQSARTLQQAMTATTADEAYDLAMQIDRSVYCLGEKFPSYQKYSDIVQARMLNTKNRSVAWLEFEKKIGGRIFPDPTAPYCD